AANDCDKYGAYDPNAPTGIDGRAPVTGDPKLAVPACEKAALEHPSNLRFLNQLAKAQTLTNNKLGAIDTYKIAAEKGSAFAMDRLGTAYAEGFVVKPDFEKAKNYFLQAIDAGNVS